MPRRDLSPYGLLIVDEVHHLPAPTYRAIAAKAAAPWRLGLSATPERENDISDDEDSSTRSAPDDSIPVEFENTILGQELGPVVFELNYADAIRLSILPPFPALRRGLAWLGRGHEEFSAGAARRE